MKVTTAGAEDERRLGVTRRSDIVGRVGRRSCALAAIVVGLLTCPSVAWASGDVASAAELYDRAEAAQARGDFGEAARLFAEADEAVPSDVALRAALRAALLGSDAVLVMKLADRADRSSEPKLVALVSDSRRAMRSRVGRLTIACPLPCEVSLDGAIVSPSGAAWVLPGEHRVAFARGGAVEDRAIEVVAGSEQELAPAPLPARQPAVSHDEAATRPEPGSPKSRGVSPWWLAGGAGVVAALGVGAGLSWADATGRRDEFVAQGCARVGSDACSGIAEDGSAALTRTNVFLGAAAVAAVATAVVAVLVVDWRPRRPSSARVGGPLYEF